jgi:hypothetical protein
MKLEQREIDVWEQAKEAVAAEDAGLSFGSFRRVRPNTPGNAEVIVQAGNKKYEFLVEVKRGILTAAVLPGLETLLNQVGSGRSLLVAASQIGPSVAKLLRERNIAFMDAAGNAFIAGSGLHVWISGKRSGVKQAVTGLHRQSAMKVIFALLTDPSLDKDPGEALLNSPVRALAKAADVAMGSVGNVLINLRSMGFLLEDDESRRLVERERLIELWATDYLARLRHRLIHHRYRMASPPRDWESLPSLPQDAWWGGQVAGALLTRHLRPEKVTIYARALPDEWIVRAKLQPDPEGNVEVLTPFWGDNLAALWQRGSKIQPSTCVHPLLVYADLLADGEERSSETAKRIYDTYLRHLATSS